MPGYIGQSLRRREDLPLLTGRGRFVADGQRPGLVHLVFRRALVPNGQNLRVDVEGARSMPGVVGAWVASDLALADAFMPHMGPEPPERRPVLASGRVRFEGDAVAVVAAESEYQAADAAEAILVDVDDLALERPDVSARHEFGDVEAAFKDAPVTVHGRVTMAQISGGAIEPRACLAEWFPEEERLEIRATVGWVHGLRAAVAGGLGLKPEQVTALTEDVGGTYGAKNHPYPEYIVAAALARQLGRPVRWVAARTEDSLTTAQAHGAVLDLEVAADADGRLRGIRGEIDWPVGAYVTMGAMMGQGYASHMVSAYRLPALQVSVRGRVSTGPPASFIRGGGRPVGNYGTERMMDRLARRLGLDPVELRRRNLIPTEAMPYETGFQGQVYDGGDYDRLLRLATERAGHKEIRERQRAGEAVGLGVAMCVESTGGFPMPEPSRVVVHGDGRAEVFVGSTPSGQGHETFLAQVAADRLGWPLEQVAIHAGDSRNVPFAGVTAGSRSALEVGNSVALSAASARRQLLERASAALEAAPEDIEVGVSGAVVRGTPSRGVPLETLVGEGLMAFESWTSKGSAWASSCHVAVVRLDLETGGVAMERYVIAHDSGQPINPLLLDGQLHGGYAHGLGYALFEECIYSDDGRFVGPSFLDYTIASAPEVAAEPELIHTQTPTGQNPEGVRGAGEAGTIAVPAAIANAVEDALHAAGRPVEVEMVPVTPLRLWELLSSGS
ncbi:MAG TPA: xanthine dehydrogenase family protein molybdopterin-binding subunit [Candidatus Dormibacteraeota bacterium]